MKENLYLQVQGEEIDLRTFSKVARQAWKRNGRPLKSIEQLDFYIKPEENKCYYVINSQFAGQIDYRSVQPKE